MSLFVRFYEYNVLSNFLFTICFIQFAFAIWLIHETFFYFCFVKLFSASCILKFISGVVVCAVCQAQPKPASHSPAGGWDSLIITTVGNHHTTSYTIQDLSRFVKVYRSHKLCRNHHSYKGFGNASGNCSSYNGCGNKLQQYKSLTFNLLMVQVNQYMVKYLLLQMILSALFNKEIEDCWRLQMTRA